MLYLRSFTYRLFITRRHITCRFIYYHIYVFSIEYVSVDYSLLLGTRRAARVTNSLLSSHGYVAVRNLPFRDTVFDFTDIHL